jgi:hypothetical protein
VPFESIRMTDFAASFFSATFKTRIMLTTAYLNLFSIQTCYGNNTVLFEIFDSSCLASKVFVISGENGSR